MMKYIAGLFFIIIFCISCKEQNKTNLPQDNIKSETKDKVTSSGSDGLHVYTKFEYADAIGKRLIIQNGFPRGGLKYTDPNGKVYVYAVFWTRIINETDNPLELKISFPVDSYELPSSPGRSFKILLPSDTMSLDKVNLFNYGLDLESFLDNGIHKSSSLKRTINPKESSGFYVVTLFNKGVDSALRTGLSLKDQNLFYRVKVDGSKNNNTSSDKEIHCGSINLHLK